MLSKQLFDSITFTNANIKYIKKFLIQTIYDSIYLFSHNSIQGRPCNLIKVSICLNQPSISI